MSEMIQQPLPLAFVYGEAVIEQPEDLYIPPDALAVVLEAFEGPLDLLLYLIRKHKFNILDLPLVQITRQYMEYVAVMKDLKLELAGEYLLMAAILAEIKSRLLLPRANDINDDETDPRAELVRRLQEYEQLKVATVNLDNLPRLERDTHLALADVAENYSARVVFPDVDLRELMLAMQSVLVRVKAFSHHQVSAEKLSTRDRMRRVLEQLPEDGSFMAFIAFFEPSEGRAGVVVTFLAILELVKESLIALVQAEPFADIHVKRRIIEA